MESLNRGDGMYNPKKCSSERPTINKDFGLMCDSEFMDKQKISNKCSCSNSNICKQLIDLFNNKKREQIEFLYDNWDTDA